MISIYTGTPGSGKSLHMASKIKGLLRRREILVITNFEINREMVSNPDNLVILDAKQLRPSVIIGVCKDYWQSRGEPVKEERIFVFIDEAQLFFNSREWRKNQSVGWIDFFTQHRKYGVNIVMVAQFIDMIDRQIRSLIEYQYVHRKLSNLTGMGFLADILLWLISFATFGKLFVAIEVWIPMKQRTGAQFYIARPGLYRLYDTFKIWQTERINDNDEDSDS